MVRHRASRAFPALIHTGKQAEGSTAMLELACAFDPFGLFSAEMGQKFPNHSAVHLQLLRARNGRLSPYFSSRDHQCSLFTLITLAGSEEAGVNGVVGLRETNRVRSCS
jgi:hypothetical protein